MRLRILLFPVVLALLAVATSWAENPVKAKIPDAKTADGKHYTVEFENQFVRVLCIHYGPKEAGNMHDHPHSVTVFLTGGHLKMTIQDGRTFTGTVPKGKVVWEEAGPYRPENLSRDLRGRANRAEVAARERQCEVDRSERGAVSGPQRGGVRVKEEL